MVNRPATESKSTVFTAHLFVCQCISLDVKFAARQTTHLTLQHGEQSYRKHSGSAVVNTHLFLVQSKHTCSCTPGATDQIYFIALQIVWHMGKAVLCIS